MEKAFKIVYCVRLGNCSMRGGLELACWRTWLKLCAEARTRQERLALLFSAVRIEGGSAAAAARTQHVLSTRAFEQDDSAPVRAIAGGEWGGQKGCACTCSAFVRLRLACRRSSARPTCDSAATAAPERRAAAATERLK
eukprot:283702-Pleurochrysis_carterae.AAC.1